MMNNSSRSKADKMMTPSWKDQGVVAQVRGSNRGFYDADTVFRTVKDEGEEYVARDG